MTRPCAMCTFIYGTAMQTFRLVDHMCLEWVDLRLLWRQLNLTTGPVRVLDRYRRTFFRATAGARVLSSADVVNARFGIHCSDAAGSINSSAGTHSARGMSPATTNGRCQSGEVGRQEGAEGRQAGASDSRGQLANGPEGGRDGFPGEVFVQLKILDLDHGDDDGAASEGRLVSRVHKEKG